MLVRMRKETVKIPRPLIERLRRIALSRGQSPDELQPLLIEALRVGSQRPAGPPPLPPGWRPRG